MERVSAAVAAGILHAQNSTMREYAAYSKGSMAGINDGNPLTPQNRVDVIFVTSASITPVKHNLLMWFHDEFYSHVLRKCGSGLFSLFPGAELFSKFNQVFSRTKDSDGNPSKLQLRNMPSGNRVVYGGLLAMYIEPTKWVRMKALVADDFIHDAHRELALEEVIGDNTPSVVIYDRFAIEPEVIERLTASLSKRPVLVGVSGLSCHKIQLV